jgi:hypothetical protein
MTAPTTPESAAEAYASEKAPRLNDYGRLNTEWAALADAFEAGWRAALESAEVRGLVSALEQIKPLQDGQPFDVQMLYEWRQAAAQIAREALAALKVGRGE